MNKKDVIHKWNSAPISTTCEVYRGSFCGEPTTHAYPAMGRGWMALCHEHAKPHKYAKPITELIMAGEVLIQRDQKENRMKSRSSGASA